MPATSSLAVVVMMQNVRTISPLSGCRHPSQIPAMPNGLPDFMAMANGCFALAPFTAFHSKKLSTGTMHRRFAKESRNIGALATRSAVALMGFTFGEVSFVQL